MNKPLTRLTLCVCLCPALLPLAAHTARAQQSGRAGTSEQRTRPPQADDLPELPDVEVLDQDGRRRKFYSDLVKGRVVVINFIYTSCQVVCPMTGRNFAQLQDALGEKFGREVFLISVSTDPARDTPARLKSWARAVGARTEGGGWTLLTGEPKQVGELLKVLTGDGTRTGYHVPAVYLRRDAPDGRVAWAYGLAAPQQLMKTLEMLGETRATQGRR
jgi:protein SCO1